MMRTIRWHLETGKQGGDLEGEVEVEDDATAEEVEAEVRNDMWGFLSLTWEEIPPDTQGAER